MRLIGAGRRASSRVLEVLREEGPSGLWLRGLDATIYRRLIIVARSPAIVPAEQGGIGEPAEIEFSFLGIDEAPEYAGLRPDAAPAETERRLTTGQRCLVGRRDGLLVHARWISTERLESDYLGLSFELPPATAYVSDVFTARRERRSGISVRAIAYYSEVLRREGVRTVLGSTWPGNVAGTAMLRASGQERIGTLAALRLGAARIPLRGRMPRGYVGAAHRFRAGAG